MVDFQSPPALPVPTRARSRRQVLTGASALGIASLVLPGASAAASTLTQALACGTPTLTTVPFVAQGASADVGEVTITATTNEATSGQASGFAAGTYRHESAFASTQTTVLTFSPTLATIEFTTAFHTDGVTSPKANEVYTLTGETASGTVLFTDVVRNQNTTLLRPATGTYAPGIARLVIEYTGEPLAGYEGVAHASLISFRILAC